jgi:thymidylate kinase
MEGNAFALSHPMDLLIIPTVPNPEELLKRLENRKEKKDDCDFENLNFQLKLKSLYESEDFQNIFKSLGTKIIYIDASISVEQTKNQAIEAFEATFEVANLRG